MESPGAGIAFLNRPKRPTNAYEETMQRLLQSIRLGIIPAGERLPSERELGEMLKVSRDTVREALSTLVEHGYVVSKRGRYGGTFVVESPPNGDPSDLSPVELDGAELDDITVLRKVLEVGAARTSAARDLTASNRAALQAALEDSLRAGGADYRRFDSRLHLLIAELTGSRSLVQMAADLRTRVNAAFEEIPVLGPNIVHSNEQHAAVVQAILTGKPDAAARAMLEHVEGSASLLRGFLATSASTE